MNLSEALTLFLVQLEADGRSENTIGQYRRHIGLFASALGDPELEETDHQIVAKFMASRMARLRPDGQPKKESSVNCLRSSLRTFFKYTCDAGLAGENPARLLRRARCSPGKPRALTEREEGRLVAALDQAATAEERRDGVLFRLMLATGVRIGTALRLDVDDVGEDEIWVCRAKSETIDVVPLPENLRKLIEAWCDQMGRGPLFRTDAGRRLPARQARRRFAGWLKRAGIERVHGTHALRHTVGARVYAKTGDILGVMRALGHRSIASSVVYAGDSDAGTRS